MAQCANFIVGISTHTPLAGRDDNAGMPSLRTFISTHTPLAGRDMLQTFCLLPCFLISTHTPLAGRDFIFAISFAFVKIFLLTRPSRDVTPLPVIRHILQVISTHTPLAGRDGMRLATNGFTTNFYSHAPRGT